MIAECSCNGSGGAHQATVEIREAQMNSKGKKKKLAIIDYGKMTQGGMTGKGRTIEVRRLPRPR